nr:MAG TPA: Testis expressed sequence 15 [Caudoviricetes sp.]
MNNLNCRAINCFIMLIELINFFKSDYQCFRSTLLYRS